jgi:hypothetical protein
MTDEEREIRKEERRILADVRRAKREVQKIRESMTPEEHRAYLDNMMINLGFVLHIPEGFKPDERNPPECRPYWKMENPPVKSQAV